MAGTFIFLPLTTQAADTTIKGTGATSATAGLEVTNSSDTSLLYVRNDGNLGIGTTEPGAKLNVVGETGSATAATFIVGDNFAPQLQVIEINL